MNIDDIDVFWSVFGAIILGGMVLWHIYAPTPLIQTQTDYRLVCSSTDSSGGQCRAPATPTETKFAVNEDRQTVVKQTGDMAFEQLSDCTVMGAKNWNCRDGTSLVGMLDGRFWSSSPNPSVTHISKWRYRWIVLRDWIAGL